MKNTVAIIFIPPWISLRILDIISCQFFNPLKCKNSWFNSSKLNFFSGVGIIDNIGLQFNIIML